MSPPPGETLPPPPAQLLTTNGLHLSPPRPRRGGCGALCGLAPPETAPGRRWGKARAGGNEAPAAGGSRGERWGAGAGRAGRGRAGRGREGTRGPSARPSAARARRAPPPTAARNRRPRAGQSAPSNPAQRPAPQGRRPRPSGLKRTRLGARGWRRCEGIKGKKGWLPCVYRPGAGSSTRCLAACTLLCRIRAVGCLALG